MWHKIHYSCREKFDTVIFHNLSRFTAIKTIYGWGLLRNVQCRFLYIFRPKFLGFTKHCFPATVSYDSEKILLILFLHF